MCFISKQKMYPFAGMTGHHKPAPKAYVKLFICLQSQLADYVIFPLLL